MPAQQSAIKQFRNKEKKKIRKMRSLIVDSESVLSFTALQVLFVSIAFIFMVLCLHIAIRIAPSTSPVTLFTSVMIICFSIALSAYINQK